MKKWLKLNIQKTNIMASCPINSWYNRWGNNGNGDRFYFGGLQNHCRWLTVAMKLKDACSLEKSYDQPTQHIEKQRHHFANKGPCSQSYFFPVVMYGCESWTIKKAEC